MKMKGREPSLIAEISDILGIRTTGRKILSLLVRTKKKLSLSEMIARTKRSERSIRAQLKILTKLELVRREVSITKKGRLAYRYFVPGINELAKLAKKEALRQLRRLKRCIKGIRER